MEIWSGGVTRDHSLLRKFGCLAYVGVKKDTLDPNASKLVSLRYKEDLKGYKLWDPKNKKFVSSKHVTLDEALMSRPTVFQQMEIEKTKLVLSQRVESDTTPRSLVVQFAQYQLGSHW